MVANLGQGCIRAPRRSVIAFPAYTSHKLGELITGHPETQALSRNSGFRRDCGQNPYAGYVESRALMFPVIKRAPGPWHPKEWALGIAVKGKHKAYPFTGLGKLPLGRLQDELADETFEIRWNEANKSATLVKKR